jgi:predicted DsbA family dithiol-disulfide isomerase
LSRQPFSYNSIDAHTLVRASHPRGTQRALHRAIIEAYFIESLNISAGEVLTAIALKHGFTAAEVAALLADPHQRQVTIRAGSEAQARGVRSVPTMVAEGRYLLPGGPAAEFAAALNRVLETS